MPGTFKLGLIFVAAGAVLGLLRGDGVAIGAAAGAIMYAIVFGVGWLAEFGRR